MYIPTVEKKIPNRFIGDQVIRCIPKNEQVNNIIQKFGFKIAHYFPAFPPLPFPADARGGVTGRPELIPP